MSSDHCAPSSAALPTADDDCQPDPDRRIRHSSNDVIEKGVSFRKSLPVPMMARADVSLWSILKNCIGKDLSRITMPVVFNEPLSFLQRVAESMAYPDLLDYAADAPDPVERLEYVAAFVVASVSNNWMRMNKPFNPLLGETYEYRDEKRGFTCVCEQVSHHPPVSAFHVESEKYAKSGSLCPKLKFWGKSIEVKPEGGHTLRLKTINETYTWANVNCCVHNIIVGKLWFEQYGTLEVINHNQDLKAVLNFKPAGWFGKDLHRVDGFICRKSDSKKIKILYGKWTDYLKSVTVEEYETYLSNNNSQQFTVPDKADIVLDSKSLATKKTQCSSAQSTPKKVTAKLSHLSLRNFTSSLESDSVRSNESPNETSSLVLPDSESSSNARKTEGGELNKSDSSGSLDIPNARLLWIADSRPDNSVDFYNFSKFTFALNDLNEQMRSYLPPSDSRYRPDIRLLEAGQIDASAEEKNRLEEKQREIRKQRKKNKESFSPLWFKIEKNPHTKEESWIFNGEYFKRDFTKCPDIF